MTGTATVLGSLHSVDGEGTVRLEDRFDMGIDDLWGAITEPERLARWYGEVEECEPPQHLLLAMRDPDARPGQPERTAIEAWLTADGARTKLVWETRGMPLDLLPAYGAGIQIHVEHLADYLAGRELRDAESR